MRAYLYGNAVGLSLIAFASYFDVYSHRHIFIGTDPWWNPAHLLLYAGFAIVALGVNRGRPRGAVGILSVTGVVVVIVAAAFNEVWHRVLLFGNPLPEPFPVEPPHALLAVGLILLGVAAILQPLGNQAVVSDSRGRAALAFIGGSLWLIVVGSAFFVAGAYSSVAAYLFAVGVGSFAASLFLAFPTALASRFGYSTLSYLWFLLVYYGFFISPADGLPLGIGLVMVVDFVLARSMLAGIPSRYLVLPVVAILYGVVYYPILPPVLTLAINAGMLASVLGVATEFSLERALLRRWHTLN
jgi:hypothetical protein